MELSRESLDFGTCLVGQRRELQILISNKTASHSSWQTSIGNLYLLVSCSRYMAEILQMRRKTLYSQSIVSCKIILHCRDNVFSFHLSKNFFFLRSGPQWRFTLKLQYINLICFCLDTCSDTCSQNTFCIEPNSGVLDAHITHVSNSKTLLRVYFTAK